MNTITGNLESLVGAGTGYVTATLAGYGNDVPRIIGTGVLVNPVTTSLPGATFSLTLYGNDQITPSNTWYTLSFYDTTGRLVSSGNYTFGSNLSYDLSTATPLPSAPAGQPSALTSVDWSNITNKPQGRAVPANFFGTHYLYASPDQAASYSKPQTPFFGLGFGALRLWDVHTNWLHLEPTQGTYYWNNLDWYVNFAQANGMDVMLTLGQPPTWATGGLHAGPSTNYNIYPPTNNQDWVDYITAVATRYKGRIMYYEVWNEPPGFFNGTQAQLATLTQLAYTTLKAIDPNIKVISACPVGFSAGAGATYLDGYLAAGAAGSIDIVGFHFYVDPNQPEKIIDEAQSVRSVMAKYGLQNLPLWNTETGWFSYTSGGTTLTTQMSDKQSAAYAIRMYLAAWIAGLDRCYFYALDQSTECLRLIDSTNNVTAAGNSVQRFIAWAKGQRIDAFNRNSDNSYQLATTDSAGNHWWLLWTDDNFSATLTLASESSVDKATLWDNSNTYPTSASSIATDMAPMLLSGVNAAYYDKNLHFVTGSGLTNSGQFLAIDGSRTSPGIAFSSATNTGFLRNTDGSLAFSIAGGTALSIYGDSFRFISGNHFTDSSTGNRFCTFTNANAVANSITNHLNLTNAAAGSAPTLGIQSSGTSGTPDANVSMNITPKGTGVVNVTSALVATGNVTGPNLTNIVAKAKLSGQTAALASTTLYTPAAAGTYRVSVASYVTTLGTAGTMDVQVAASNGSFSQTYGYTTFANMAPGLQAMSGNSYRTNVAIIHVGASQPITYSTIWSGVTGTPAYGLDIVVEQLQ